MQMGFKANLKVVDETDDKWIVEGYASVFGNVDSYYEIVEKGAFTEFLAQYPKDPKTGVSRFPKFIWAHDWSRPLGPTLEAREDEIGLYVRGELLKDVQDAKEAYALIKSGAMTDLSFGFRVRESDMNHDTGVLHLKKIDIYEWSPVLVGANPKATITGFKDASGADIKVPAEAIVPGPEEAPAADAPADDSAAGDTPAPVAPEGDAPAAADEAAGDEAPGESSDSTPAAPADTTPNDEGKEGAALSMKAALAQAVAALKEATDALEALNEATEDSEPAKSEDTPEVESREGKGSSDDRRVVKAILRDAREADRIMEKVIVRAKTFIR